jgi:diguanylate cyclase (GGDEF)-like protein
MQASDDRLVDALFRLLAGRPGFAAAALYRRHPVQGAALAAASAGFRAMRVADAAPPATAEGRVDPACLGLAAGFAAVAPVRGPDGAPLGLLAVADRRPRRLTAAGAARLADAAALAAPLLRADAPAPAAPALRGTIRLRTAAQRLVEAAIERRGAGVALMMLDLDRFRSVDAALGAAAGDALLAATARRIEAALGREGRMMRLEGDRFLVVAAVDVPGAAALARRLLVAVGQPLPLDDRMLTVQASIGVVAGLRGTLPTALLLSQADAALRRAKAEGRNRYVLHEPAEAVAALESSRLELDLAGALAGGQFHLAYQPFVDLRDGRVSGVEALLRWRHPSRGALLPAAFIPMAEATGQILPLGRWALRAALAEAARWPAALGLAVNISPLQFHQPGFLAEVDAALADSGFPASRLELEITETVLMRDNPDTTAQLRALIARGVRIALDDFGTGYSALAYLARLPHHRIKLDKAFVQNLANPATADLIRAILALARAQGVAVTAEGVERPEDLALVRRIGFSHAQGYAIGAPRSDPAALLAADIQACTS